MRKTPKYAICLVLIGVFLVSGCLDGQTDVTAFAKTLPQVESFLAEHPNADIRVALWSESSVSEAIDQIRLDCEAPVEVKSYYKITLVEGSEDIVIWMDKLTNEAVCIIREGSDAPTSTPSDSDQGTTDTNVAKTGDTVKVDYWLTVDGEQIDSNEGRGLFEFTIGSGQVITGFNEAVIGMKIGETKSVTLTGSDAYTSGPLAGEDLYFTITLREINNILSVEV
jgi:hypothetical protein